MTNITDYRKDDWRLINLRFISTCEELWDGAGKLKYSYLELVGESGKEMYALLADKLHNPKQFIGIDKKLDIIYQHWKDNVPWMAARADGYIKARFVASLSKEERREIGLTNYPLAIYGFDDSYNVGGKWWNTEMELLQDIVQHTLEQAATCVLILNNTLDRNTLDGKRIEAQVALKTHTEKLCETFKNWKLTPERILGPNLKELKLVEQGWIGWAGGYHIYKSEKRPLRMATIRLELHKNRIRVGKKFDTEVQSFR